MKNFNYIKPKDLAEASRLLKTYGADGVPFAGGTDLLGLMKDGIIKPSTVIDLKSIPNLDKLIYTPGQGLTIGALVPLAEIARLDAVLEKYTALAQAAAEAASPQIRNLGTIAGNLCQRPRCWYFRGDFNCLRKGGDTCFAVEGENKYHCITDGGPCFIIHPSDTAVALLCLEASISIFSNNRTTTIPIRDFFTLPSQNITSENILKPGDIITQINIPDISNPTGSIRSGFLKQKERTGWDFATVSAAAIFYIEDDTIISGSVSLGGIAPIQALKSRYPNNCPGAPSTRIELAKSLPPPSPTPNP